MRAFLQLAVATAVAFVGLGAAAPVQVVHPGGVGDIVITNQDTLNGTRPTNSSSSSSGVGSGSKPVVQNTAGTQQLPFAFVNNFAGSVNAYVTGLNTNNEVVLLQPDGTFYAPTVSPGTSVPQPITANVAIPLGGQGSTTNIQLPDYISAARVWFAAGDLQFYVVADGNGNPSLVEPSSVNPSDPNADINWGFVELTNTADGGLFANISYVDFVGMVLGMTLTSYDGSTQSAPGLPGNAVASICSDLKAAAAVDGQPWDQLCMVDGSGNPLRIIAPGDYLSGSPNAFSDYFTNYIQQVWDKYTNEPLLIDTQAAAGQVSCQVSGGTLYCDGDNRGYAQPVAGDIFGCNSGPFAIEAGDNAVHYAVVPRLCAAFDRSTLLLSGGNSQPGLPASSYYTAEPTNQYSAIIHKYEVNGQGYAFAYDDVTPDGAPNASGVVADASPELLTITIGGPAA